MTTQSLIILIILFFLTSAVGVVTGSNSLITVPVMFQFGIDPRVAVATNMFGLTFGAVGASIPFLGKGVIERAKMPVLSILTVAGSALGAALVNYISGGGIRIIVTAAMIFVCLFTLLKRNAGVNKTGPRPVAGSAAFNLAYTLTFLLAIYGGLYSGGYVTMLTASYVAFFGMTFTEAVATTKVINVFSSLIATLIFAWQGLIDYRLGLILGLTMFVGAYAGARIVTKLNDALLKRIFIATVLLLAAKMIYDFASA
jgi:uncharacterized protein